MYIDVGSLPSKILLSQSNVGASLSNVGVTLSDVGATLSNVSATLRNVGVTLSNVGATLSNVSTTLSNAGAMPMVPPCAECCEAFAEDEALLRLGLKCLQGMVFESVPNRVRVIEMGGITLLSKVCCV